MTVAACGHDHSGDVVCLIPGPSVVLKTEEAGDKWCFKCRQRQPHTWVLLDDPPERQPSYYEPIWVLRCPTCRGDYTAFPRSIW